MDVFLPFNGTVFEWDDGKATANLRKHGIKFEEATEVFFDPQAVRTDASVGEEARGAILGYSMRLRMLLVVHVERGEHIRIISARAATRSEEKNYDEG